MTSRRVIYIALILAWLATMAGGAAWLRILLERP